MVGDPTDELTVLQAIARLRVAGFDADASAVEGGLRCTTCDLLQPVAEVEVLAVLRVEGVSDPADQAIILGLRCTVCGTHAVLVAGYGPEASAVDQDLVAGLA